MIRRLAFLVLGLLLGTSAVFAFAQVAPPPVSPSVDSLPASTNAVTVTPIADDKFQSVSITIDLPEVRTLYGTPHAPDGKRFCHYIGPRGHDEWRTC